METGPNPLMTLREAAELARSSPDWLKKQIERGLLGCFRVAGKIVISPEQLADFLALVEKRPKIGGRGFTAFARDGIPVFTDNGWIWRPKNHSGDEDEADRLSARVARNRSAAAGHNQAPRERDTNDA